MTEQLTHCPKCGKMLRHSWDFDDAGRQVATVLCIGYGGSCDYKKPIEAAMTTEPLTDEQIAELTRQLANGYCSIGVWNAARVLAEENANLKATLRRCCAYAVRDTTL